jgi:hypothetical protein
MRTILVALVLLATSSLPSLAQHYHHRPAPHYHHHHQYHSRPHHANPWVAPFVGGLLGGAIVGGALAPHYYAPAPVCSERLVSYDVWGRPIIERTCY